MRHNPRWYVLVWIKFVFHLPFIVLFICLQLWNGTYHKDTDYFFSFGQLQIQSIGNLWHDPRNRLLRKAYRVSDDVLKRPCGIESKWIMPLKGIKARLMWRRISKLLITERICTINYRPMMLANVQNCFAIQVRDESCLDTYSYICDQGRKAIFVMLQKHRESHVQTLWCYHRTYFNIWLRCHQIKRSDHKPRYGYNLTAIEFFNWM